MKKILIIVLSLILIPVSVFSANNKEESVMEIKTMENGVLPPNTKGDYKKPSEKELRDKLTDLQFRVTQKDATERAFNNSFWDNHEEGIYVDIVSGEALFSSTDKYESGTGWPSFTKPLESGNVAELTDSTFGMVRTEVRSLFADSHLGHLFNDGPQPTGNRYCINSASLRFIHVEDMKKEGYEKYSYLFEKM